MADDEFNLDDDLNEFHEDDADQSASPKESSAGSKPNSKRRVRLVIGAIATLVVIVGGALFFFSGRDSSQAVKKQAKYVQQASVPSELTDLDKKTSRKKKKKRVKYVTLFSLLNGDQTARILKELSFQGILFRTEQSGRNFTIEVDAEEEEMARNLLAVKELPAGKVKGYALLDDAQTLGVTEFDKRIRFLRALSGELETAIIQFEMIEDAKVQIVLPEQRLFAVTQPPVTSSILIRKGPNGEITDDVVYAIIQLVSNAVENLQPENVSVINTGGLVLSEGIFERMAEKRLGGIEEIVVEEEPEEEVVRDPREDAMGHPIVPNYEKIRDWFEIKWEFEQSLVERATKQLMGILPAGSFKVAITSDLGPLEGGEIVDVKRLTISIVVDNLNEDVILDAVTKRRVFATVSGAVGYEKGRDNIQLSKADFTLLTPEERSEIARLQGTGESPLKKILIGLGLVAALGGGFAIVKFFRSRGKAGASEILGDNRSADFSDIQEELDGEKHVEKIRSIAENNPIVLAKIMEEWLREDDDTVDSVMPELVGEGQQ